MKKRISVFIFLIIILSAITIPVSATTTITPTYCNYTEPFSTVKKRAKTVSTGDYLVSIKNAGKGYLQFTPSSSGTYVFTASGLKSSTSGYALGYITFEQPETSGELEMLDVETQGGTTDAINIATRDDDPDEEEPEELYLRSRYAKINLTKGDTLYIFYNCTGCDSFKLYIKKSGSSDSSSSSKMLEPSYTKVKLNAFGTYNRYDITGDGYTDKIEFIHDKEASYYRSMNKVTVRINDKTALTKSSSWGYTDMGAYLLKLSGKKYLFLYSIGEHNEGDIVGFFRYNGSKLVEDVNLTKETKSIGRWWMKGLSISNGKIYLLVEGVSQTLYRVYLKPYLEIKGGKLALSSKKIPFVKESGYNGHLCNGSYFETTRDVVGYKSYSGSKKVFTIKKGTKIKFLIFYPGYPARFYVKTKSGDTCWIKDAGERCISGIYNWA